MIKLFKEFEKEVMEAVYNRLENVKVIPDVVLKNNGLKLHELSITTEGEKLGVYVYLDALYSGYLKCKLEFSEVVDSVVEQFKEGIHQFAFDISCLGEYESVKKLIRGRLLNTEKNEEILRTVPHRNFLDLSIVYYIDIKPTDGKGVGSMRIDSHWLERWGIDEEMLYQQMLENMQQAGEGKLSGMATVMEELFGMDMGCAEPEFPMYVLTNQQRANGAIEILNKTVFEKAVGILGENFWILPSSLHEWILLPMKNGLEDTEYLRSMIREINDTQVATEDILSYNLYCYRQETGKIEIAA